MSSMSTISFPNPHSPSHRDSPSDSVTSQSLPHSSEHHINFFPSAFDPQTSTSSFQINPLSSHPPRTPRTSIITSSVNAFPGEIYSSTEEREERPFVMAASEEDEDEEKLETKAGKRVKKEEVWREVLATSTGRDKALKLIQYSMRVYILFHASVRTRLGAKYGDRPPWEDQLFQRMSSTMSGLSLTRKCLILFNWLTPLTAITTPQPLPYASSSKLSVSSPTSKKPPAPPFLHTFLHAPPPVLLDLLNSLSDDIATLSRLGLIGKRVGERAANLANWCWFSGTLVGLVEVGVEQGLIKSLMDETESRLYSSTSGSVPGAGGMNATDEKELERLRKQYFWLRVSRAKLLMDLVFVSYECFKFKRAREPVMGISGLLSAALSSMKLYDRHRTSLMKALTH